MRSKNERGVHRRNGIHVGVAAVLIAGLAFGCAPTNTSKPQVSIAPPSSVPGPSVSSGTINTVSPGLKGAYQLNQHACYQTDGQFRTQLETIENEKLTIGDTSWIDSYNMGDGCTVTFTYDIQGVSTSKVTIGNLRVTLSYYGAPDTNDSCAQYRPPAAAPGQSWTYGWVAPSGEFALLSAPTGQCAQNEWDADVFERLSSGS